MTIFLMIIITTTIMFFTPPAYSQIEFTAGDSKTINWYGYDASGTVEYYSIDYSTDGGSTWTNSVDWTAGNPGTHIITIPDVETVQGRYRVALRDNSGNVSYIVNSDDFTIVPLSWLEYIASQDTGGERILHWRLGESSGTTADNVEGTATWDGTYNGSGWTYSQTGLVDDADTCVDTDGSSTTYLYCTDASSNMIGDSECSFELLTTGMPDEASATRPFFAKNGRDGIEMARVGTYLTVYIDGAANRAEWRGAAQADWTGLNHWLIVFDGGETGDDRLKIWRNGSALSLTYTGSMPATLGDSTAQLEVGRYATGYFIGDIDEFIVWDDAKDGTYATASHTYARQND